MRLLAGILTLVATTTALAQGPATRRPEVIRGRVTSDSGRVLAGITVIATMAPDRTFRQAVTDTGGRYEIRFELGTGDYLVYAGPVGYRAFRRRIAIGATGSITVDIRLVNAAAQLAAVRVSAQRPRPIPDGGQLRDPTAADFSTQNLLSSLPPDAAGDLTTLAATVPGMTVTPDGRLSAFGLPGQVQYTFNGSTLAATEIPRDAAVAVRVIPSAFDPSIGGFGGALVNVEMVQGGRVAQTFGRITLDAPQLQPGDANTSRLGQRLTSVDLNGNASGPIVSHDAFYNTAARIRRSTRPISSLFDADADVLSLAGISSDSVARLRSIAPQLGLPLGVAGAPSDRFDERGSFITRLDHYKDPARYGKLWSNAFSLTALGGFSRSGFVGGAPTVAPTVGRESHAVNGQLIGAWLHMNERMSTELTSSLGGAHSSNSPYLFAPGAIVRIQSALAQDEVATQFASLGGTDVPTSSNNSESWETWGALNFYAGSSHRIRLYSRQQFGAMQADPSGDRLGTFTYNSLADLAANRPASFSRTFGSSSGNALLWNGALSAGDLWQITPNFQLQPGVRFEANRFRDNVTRNDALFSALGVDNTNVPNTMHASPRLGFSWTYRPTRANFGTGTSTIGRITLPPRATLSGGIGEFRQDLGATSLLPVITNTGLGSQNRRLTCVGDATPTADWRSFVEDAASVPTTCAAGAATTFVDAAPTVAMFDPAFVPAHSWRGNLRFGSALGPFRYSLDGWYSDNVDQPGTRDLNLRTDPRFVLSDEGNRPIFVSPSSIVPATGLVSQTEARKAPSFGRVTDNVSDLHSTARQVTLLVAPELKTAVISVAYTLSDVTAAMRGFDATTFGSPDAIETSRSPFATRHQLFINTGYQLGSSVGLSMSWRIASGVPYTPVVGSDINGDGLPNDRAFIFNPATVADRNLGAQLATLLAQAPSQSRSCIASQLGTAAGAYSCTGPWTSTMNAALSTSFLHVLDGRYIIGSLNLSNPLGGLDQLLHGADHLRGWGAPAIPDPILYTVQGFDPVANRYRYAVNPRFGSTRPSQSILRVPFRMTLDFRVELGRPLRQQEFSRFLQMAALRGNSARAPADSLQARLLDYEVTDAYDYILRMRDSLLLTRDQVDSLQHLKADYTPRAAAVWRDLADYIYAQTAAPGYDVNDITHRVDALTTRAWAVLRAEVPRIRAVMTPAQLELVDIMLEPIVDSDKKIPPRPHLF
jgi:hypothetical protein